jgi:hypothetical protein
VRKEKYNHDDKVKKKGSLNILTALKKTEEKKTRKIPEI